MDKGIYIRGGSKNEFSGVNKKIKNQIMVLSKYSDMHEVIIEKEDTNIVKSVLWRLPGGSWGAKYDDAIKEIDQVKAEGRVSFFYIRISPIDKRYVHFLKTLRERNPETRILLEVPTYPYDKEYLTKKTMWPWYFKDRFNRRKITSCVDRVVTVDESQVIFGIPTLKIMNGIDVASVRPITRDNEEHNLIQIIVVAMMQPYHGYERLISGLATYYRNGGNRDIQIRMVGYGSELRIYKDMVRRYNLDSRIVFLGKLEGDDLDEAYEGCDLAVGSLGGYKAGIYKFSSIKLGEYLAKGLPVITGAPAYVFEKYGKKYNLDFPNDASEIDLNEVVSFFDGLYKGRNKADVRNDIRRFALNSIDINMTMGEVVAYLNH